MANDERPTHRRQTAQDILAQAKESFQGQQMSDDMLKKAREKMSEQAGEDHMQEAAAFTEDIIKWLNEEWNAREFTPEQRIFSLSLATINFRQHFPEDKGGKEKFDSVSKAAWRYYAENANG